MSEEGGTTKKFLYVNRRAPYGSIYALESLEVVLIGAAAISLGIFTSSLTENQIVSASISFGMLFFFWLISYSVPLVSAGLGQVLSYLSLNEHIASLSKGVVDSEDIIYYLCFIVLFLFLTLRSLETKRWR